jgi:uncharacterized protein Usg
MKENRMASQDFSRQFAGYGLTTAHIFYRRPDHPWLLQSSSVCHRESFHD